MDADRGQLVSELANATTSNSGNYVSTRYRRVRVIGEGANGTAWLCVDTAAEKKEGAQEEEGGERYVVVKCMSLPSMTAREWALVQNEIKCLSTAQHPNIIEFYEAVMECDPLPVLGNVPPTEAPVTPTTLFSAQTTPRQLIVMEFADAGDLSRIMQRRRKLQHNRLQTTTGTTPPAPAAPPEDPQQPPCHPFFSTKEVMFLFVQIAMAVHHCHEHSILHRDIKTANILMRSNGLVKLGDFGLSRRYEKAERGQQEKINADCNAQGVSPPPSDASRSSSSVDVSSATSIAQTFCGTPCYLAPELWKGHRYGKAADLWSLGIVLYEVVTLGRRPFSGSSIHALATAVVSGVYDHPSLWQLKDMNVNAQQQQQQGAAVDQGIVMLISRLLDVDPSRRPSTVALFQMPFVRRYIVDLCAAMQSNRAIPSKVRESWQREADRLLALPALENGHPPLPTRHAGFVRRYVLAPPTGGAVGGETWTLHQLSLERSGAVLVLAQPHPPTNPPAGVRREIPTSTLASVMPVPPEGCGGVPGVFAITTKDGRCNWFQAQSETEQQNWVRLIQLAIALLQ